MAEEHELLRQMATLIETAREEVRMEAKARRLLKRRAMVLRKRGIRYIVADHLGGVPGAPHRGTIQEVLAWIEVTEHTHG